MKLMTTKEAAAQLGVGTTTIKRWSDEGVLPCVKTAGGHRRYRQADVMALQQQDTPSAVSFAERLPTMSPDELDALPHGVVQLSDDGLVVQYNAAEARFSGFSRQEVVGKHFFGEIAPCTSNSLVYGRFQEGIKTGAMDARLFYTFCYRLELVNVVLRVFRHESTGTNWLIIDTGQQIATRVR